MELADGLRGFQYLGERVSEPVVHRRRTENVTKMAAPASTSRAPTRVTTCSVNPCRAAQSGCGDSGPTRSVLAQDFRLDGSLLPSLTAWPSSLPGRHWFGYTQTWSMLRGSHLGVVAVAALVRADHTGKQS